MGGTAQPARAPPDQTATPTRTPNPFSLLMADTLTITDNRTGKQHEIPITDGVIRATDLRQIKSGPDDQGLMTYDPAFMNTAACRSRITYIDGDKGILEYRGYPIEQLAERSTYLETAYLILFGELPTGAQLESWKDEIILHTMLHENIKKLMEGFQYDAHPMGVFLSTVGAFSTFYPTPSRFLTSSRGRSRSIDSSPKCPRSRPTPSATASGVPTTSPTTSSASPATSSTCCSG